MKKFIIKIIGFSMLLSIAPFFLIGLNNYYANFKISKDKKTLIFGHSHPQCAFNDSLISGVGNYAQAGESYFYTYIKIKKLVEQNANIKYVFIEFTNNLITREADARIWEDKNVNFSFPKYGSFMDGPSIKLLYENNPKTLRSNIIPLLRHHAKMISKKFNYTNEIGGHLFLKRDKTDSILKNSVQTDVSYAKSDELSHESVAYLKKIIDLCQKEKVKVLLIRSPLHKKYPDYKNEKLFQEVLKKQFSNVEFLDFSKVPITNSEFGDLSHLNHKGGKVFSIWFNSLLKKGLLEKREKQKFIDREIDDYNFEYSPQLIH